MDAINMIIVCLTSVKE